MGSSSSKSEKQVKQEPEEQDRLRYVEIENLKLAQEIKRLLAKDRERQLAEEGLKRLIEEGVKHANELRRQLEGTVIKYAESRTPSALYKIILSSNEATNFHCLRRERIFDVDIPLSWDSIEYIEIEEKFLDSCFPELCVAKISRIENPYLLGKYQLKKATLVARYGRDAIHEQLLFHGTKNQHINYICNNNLDWRLFGSNLGNRFGQGTCFARDAKYSAFYCDKEKFATKTMLVFRVLVGPICNGRSTMILPPDMDTNLPFANSCKPNGDVIVSYNDNEFYPAYKIIFTGDVQNLRAQKYEPQKRTQYWNSNSSQSKSGKFICRDIL